VEDVTEFVHLKQKEGRRLEKDFTWAGKDERMEAWLQSLTHHCEPEPAKG
jgi:hypothetical protein